MNKLKSYDNATKKLMRQAMELDVNAMGRFSLPEMVYLLRESFKYKLTYRKVFPGDPFFSNCDPSAGFCLVSSYYIYEHTGGDAVWEIMKSPVHWWLRHKQTGATFDVTYTQFKDPFPYEVGKIETRMQDDEIFANIVKTKAIALGRAARLD